MLSPDLLRHVGKYYGKYRGRVTKNEDANHQGTIEVIVPEVLGEETAIAARACMPYAHFYVPPVDAHVWIEFEGGDIVRAIWVGAWYPEGAAPAPAQLSPPDARVIQTPAGHTIEILDKAGEEKILIRHARDAFVSIDKDGSVLISNANGSHVHFDAKSKGATFVEEHGNHLAMTEKGTAIVNPEGTMVNVTGDTVHVSAKNVVLSAASVALGMNAVEPTIMGTAFQALWTLVLTHVHPSAMGPTGPAPTLAAAALQPGIHLSTSVAVK